MVNVQMVRKVCLYSLLELLESESGKYTAINCFTLLLLSEKERKDSNANIMTKKKNGQDWLSRFVKIIINQTNAIVPNPNPRAYNPDGNFEISLVKLNFF
jgi:hypothetical protein